MKRRALLKSLIARRFQDLVGEDYGVYWRPKLRVFFLVHSQRPHRVDPTRAPGWYVARTECHESQ